MSSSLALNSAAGSGSGSEGGCGVDEKKRRRMASNRESARRSRQRKQQHLDDLIKQVGVLKRENEEFDLKIKDTSQTFSRVEGHNHVLRAEKYRLAARLESLENVIEIAKVVRGSNNNNNNDANGNNNELLYELNEDPMMKPWQLPCPSLPIMASSSLRSFRFDA